MIRKRRSLSSARKGDVAPRARLSAAPVRRRRLKVDPSREAEALEEVSPVVTGSMDKRELILAHLEARRATPASLPSRTGLVIGVIVSVVIVCAGWFMTFGAGLRSEMSSGDGLLDVVRGRSVRLREDLKQPTEGAKEALKAFEANQAAQEAALQLIAEEIRRGQASSTAGMGVATSTAVISTGR